jgi:hypothetical protein
MAEERGNVLTGGPWFETAQARLLTMRLCMPRAASDAAHKTSS